MVIEAGLIDAFERMPLPHLEFKEDSSAFVQIAFSAVLGISVGILLYYFIAEVIKDIFED